MNFQDILQEKANQIRAEEAALLSKAKEKVGEKFAGHIQLITRNEKIWNAKVDLPQDLKDQGIFSTEKGVFVPAGKPYIGSGGRVDMAISELIEGKKYPEGERIKVMPSKFMEINKAWVVEKTVITPRGEATAIAKIGFGGSGVDSTNPIENAETSALARALGMLGYGLLEAGGLATAEEVLAAQQERHGNQQQPRGGNRQTTSQGGNQQQPDGNRPNQQDGTNSAPGQSNGQRRNNQQPAPGGNAQTQQRPQNPQQTPQQPAGQRPGNQSPANQPLAGSQPESPADLIHFEILGEKTLVKDGNKQYECPCGVDMSTGQKRILYGQPSMIERLKTLAKGTVFGAIATINEQYNIAIIREIAAA